MIEVTFNQNTIEYLLMILVRVSSFVYIAPFFGHSSFPARIKISFSILLTVLLYYSMPVQELQYSTVIDCSIIVIKEAITGLLIGFSAYICSSIIHFSGKIIDMEIGLSMAQVFDPATNIQTGLTGSLYSYLLMLFMIVSDMHIFLLNAIVDSYSLIPIGGIKMGSTMYNTVVGFMTNYFIIGFRLVLPVFAATLLLNCVLGVMAKVAPQMNMFAVGMQLKVMVGLIVMFATISVLPTIADFIFSQMKTMVTEMMRGMM
jgi:flagellar biosynthetic protein FliR